MTSRSPFQPQPFCDYVEKLINSAGEGLQMAHIYIFIMQEKEAVELFLLTSHWLLSQQAEGTFQLLYQTELLL